MFMPKSNRDDNGMLRVGEVTWPSNAVVGEKLAVLVGQWYRNREDMKTARGQRESLVNPGRYDTTPAHLRPSTGELREQVAKLDAEITEIQARPRVDADIRALCEDPDVLDAMQATAEQRDADASQAYIAAIDAMVEARAALQGTREDLVRVALLAGDDPRPAMNRKPQSHVAHANVDYVLTGLRKEGQLPEPLPEMAPGDAAFLAGEATPKRARVKRR